MRRISSASILHRRTRGSVALEVRNRTHQQAVDRRVRHTGPNPHLIDLGIPIPGRGPADRIVVVPSQLEGCGTGRDVRCEVHRHLFTRRGLKSAMILVPRQNIRPCRPAVGADIQVQIIEPTIVLIIRQVGQHQTGQCSRVNGRGDEFSIEGRVERHIAVNLCRIARTAGIVDSTPGVERRIPDHPFAGVILDSPVRQRPGLKILSEPHVEHIPRGTTSPGVHRNAEVLDEGSPCGGKCSAGGQIARYQRGHGKGVGVAVNQRHAILTGDRIRIDGTVRVTRDIDASVKRPPLPRSIGHRTAHRGRRQCRQGGIHRGCATLVDQNRRHGSRLIEVLAHREVIETTRQIVEAVEARRVRNRPGPTTQHNPSTSNGRARGAIRHIALQAAHRLTRRQREGANPRVPHPRPARSHIFSSIPEGTIIGGIDAHGSVIPPTADLLLGPLTLHENIVAKGHLPQGIRGQSSGEMHGGIKVLSGGCESQRQVARAVHRNGSHPGMVAPGQGKSALLMDLPVSTDLPQFIPTDTGLVRTVHIHGVIHHHGLVRTEVSVLQPEHQTITNGVQPLRRATLRDTVTVVTTHIAIKRRNPQISHMGESRVRRVVPVHMESPHL